MNDATNNLTDRVDDPITLTDDDTRVAAWQAPLLDLLCALGRARAIMVLVPILGLGLGIVQHARSVPFYRSSAVAVLLPREQHTLDVSVLTGSVETTDDRPQRADAGLLMLPPQTDLYIALIYSRPVLEQLATRFADRLTEHGPVKSRDRSDEVVLRLRDMIAVDATEEGLLTITVTADAPDLAAAIANAIVEEMRGASLAIERQLLVQQVGYLEDAVVSTSAALDAEEAVLKAFCRQYQVINPGLQSADHLRQIREMEVARDNVEAELARALVKHTESDPGVIAMRADVEMKNARIDALRGSFATDIDETEYGRLLIEYEGLRDSVRYRRDLLATLSTRADVFRIRADQPAGNIAVVRPAVPVARPAGPSKKKMFGVAVGGALVLACCLALLLEQLRTARRDPVLEGKLCELRAHVLAPVRMRRPLVREAE